MASSPCPVGMCIGPCSCTCATCTGMIGNPAWCGCGYCCLCCLEGRSCSARCCTRKRPDRPVSLNRLAQFALDLGAELERAA